MYEDNVANVPTLSRIITSLMAHLIEKSSQVLAIDQPQVLLDHDLLKLLPQLSEEMRKKLEQEVLQASLKYGHFSAHALKYVKISSFDDISRQVYLPGLEKISLPVLHTMQVNFCFVISRPLFHDVSKLLKMSHLNLLTLVFSTSFCRIKIDLSGKTI